MRLSSIPHSKIRMHYLTEQNKLPRYKYGRKCLHKMVKQRAKGALTSPLRTAPGRSTSLRLSSVAGGELERKLSARGLAPLTPPGRAPRALHEHAAGHRAACARPTEGTDERERWAWTALRGSSEGKDNTVAQSKWIYQGGLSDIWIWIMQLTAKGAKLCKNSQKTLDTP